MNNKFQIVNNKKIFSFFIQTAFFMIGASAHGGWYKNSSYGPYTSGLSYLGQVYVQVVKESLSDEIKSYVIREHKVSLDYKNARRKLILEIDRRDQNGEVYVQDYYCERLYPIKNQQMPDDRYLNIEHTWPQSRFSKRHDKEIQKSDMHHLFPVDSYTNQLRGNYLFGYVVQEVQETDEGCQNSKVGYSQNGSIRFEAPLGHRGAVARAIFYFSLRYDMGLASDEEAVLREWHHMDPVNTFEIERNNQIEKVQGNRNPFIDDPSLVDRISRF